MSTLKKKKKTKKKPMNKTVSPGMIITRTGSFLATAAIMVLFTVLPLYFKNGYTRIASVKYMLFMGISEYAAVIMGIFFVIRLCVWGYSGDELKKALPILPLTASVLIYGIVSFVSYLLSGYKNVTEPDANGFVQGAFLGTSGWYMGFATIGFILVWFFLSEIFLEYTDYIWVLIFATLILVGFFAIINRYGFYPIEMKFASESFISTIGNINWVCGYLVLVSPIAFGMFVFSEKKFIRILSAFTSTVSVYAILTNGSDSGIVAFLCILLLLLAFSLKKCEYLQRFAVFLLMVGAESFIAYLVDKVAERNYDGELSALFINYTTGLILIIISLEIFIFTGLVRRSYFAYPKKLSKNGTKVTVTALAVSIGLFAILVVINTVTGRGIPVIGSTDVFYFSPGWASDRGMTWSTGLRIYGGLPLKEKIFGAGPDCFYFALSRGGGLSEEVNEYFKNSRLTNAHNEMITMLVNEGILGLISYIGIFVTALVSLGRRLNDKPVAAVFILAISSYLVNNILSFQQILTTPLMFTILGIAGAAIIDKKAQ